MFQFGDAMKSAEEKMGYPQEHINEHLDSLTFENDMTAIRDMLRDHLAESNIPLIHALGTHIISAGGKRVRPLLMTLAAKSLGYMGKRHLALASAIELIHTATLLHDDVIDESDERRGKKTANKIWGNRQSILVGDFLFTKAFELVVNDGSLPILALLSKACTSLTKGEILQLSKAYDLALDKDTYFDIIYLKTASLFEAAMGMGVAVTGADKMMVDALASFGKNLGLIYQLKDDLLDYQRDVKHLGKKQGDDFFEGKVTLPIILTYQKARPQDQQALQCYFHAEERTEQMFHHTQEMIYAHNIPLQIRLFMEEFAALAQNFLTALPKNRARENLESILLTSLERYN